MMSKEAMKLALEALEIEDMACRYEKEPTPEHIAKAITVLRLEIDALNMASTAVKPDFWEGYVPEPDKRQQALDKKAENARALGLDYEPAQQEPVAWCVINNGEIIGEPTLYLDGAEEILAGQIEGCGSEIAPLYTSPPAQRTWVGLTDEERKFVRNSVGYNQFVTAGEYAEHVQKATEAKLKEKNT